VVSGFLSRLTGGLLYSMSEIHTPYFHYFFINSGRILYSNRLAKGIQNDGGAKAAQRNH
jgi:hypothetical protein